MARFKNDPFPGTDYNSYKSWQTVTTPDGGVYYVVPGHPEYVYDEVASNASGRKVFRRNPQQQIDAQNKAQADQDAALKQQKFAQSPVGQILPVAASTGGLIAASHFMQPAADPVAKALAEQLAGKTAAQAAASGAQTVTPALTNAGTAAEPLYSGSAAVPGSAAAGAPGVAAEAPSFGAGGTLFNSSAGFGDMAAYGPLNYAGGAIGAYGAFKASQMSNKRQGMTSGAMSGAMAGASLAPATLGLSIPIGAAIGMLAGAAAHEHTKARSTRRYGEIAGASSDANYQSMLSQGMQEDVSGQDTWDLGDDTSKAPIDLMTRSYGVLKTFGPQWASVDPAKRQEIVRQMVDKGLINSKQGSYLVDDPEAAQAIFNAVINGTPQGQAANVGTPNTTSTNMPVNTGSIDMRKSKSTGEAAAQGFAAGQASNTGPQQVGAAAGGIPAVPMTYPLAGLNPLDPNGRFMSMGGAMRAPDPGFSSGSMGMQPAAPGVVAPAVPVVPVRTGTISPGIGLNGQVLTPQQIQQLMSVRR